MKYINIIFLLSIILLYLIFYNNNSNETRKKVYDVIISINVHERVLFLMKQLDNIKENVNCNYAIILNCNDYMFEECKNTILPENVYMNPEIINKQRNHGSLTHGMYSNMNYALNNFDFKYFIICSSRSFFDNNMTLEDLNKVVELNSNSTLRWKDRVVDYDSWNWSWPIFSKTLLFKYYRDKNQELYNSAHEGLMFTYDGCTKIISFLEGNPDIKNDLFNFKGSVEEFALQTISVNSGDSFYDIGNGCYEEKLSPNTDTNLKFTYKVLRD
jgi:hypothetical protein